MAGDKYIRHNVPAGDEARCDAVASIPEEDLSFNVSTGHDHDGSNSKAVSVGAHTVASHSDTSATGTQLDELVGGGATILHSHAGGGATLAYSGATIIDAQAPEAWATIDLSGTVGANRAHVWLSINSATDMDAVSIKDDDDATEYYHAAAEANAYGSQLGHHESNCPLVLNCITSASGKVKWIVESSQTATVILLDYIK